eukprot:gene4341-3155_t
MSPVQLLSRIFLFDERNKIISREAQFMKNMNFLREPLSTNLLLFHSFFFFTSFVGSR